MTTQLTSAEQGKFLQYYNQQNNTSHSGNLSFISSLTGANLEKCISDYLDFVLDNFCEENPSHHRGNSFVKTDDQYYDVTPYAEVRFPVVNEVKDMFQFGIVNTRVGSMTMNVTKDWYDGDNQAGVRPDMVKYTVTSSYPVFTQDLLNELKMEPVYIKNPDTGEDTDEIDLYHAKLSLTAANAVLGDTNSWTRSIPNLPKYTFESPIYRSMTNTPDDGRTDFTPEGYGKRTDGTAITYSVAETDILMKVGDEYIPWYNATTSYAHSKDSVKEQNHPATHPANHTGDVYNYFYRGVVSGSVQLVTNKYWTDVEGSGSANVRPDIKTIVYRSYIKTVEDAETGVTSKQLIVERMGELGTTWAGQGTEDRRWWKIYYDNQSMYTSEGYIIDYYMQEEITTASTQYMNTETFYGEPTTHYIHYNGKDYFTLNYNGEKSVDVGSTSYLVEKYKSVTVGNGEYQVINNQVTIPAERTGAGTYNVSSDTLQETENRLKAMANDLG